MVLPMDLLETSINREVAIRLKDGRILIGKLSGYDAYLNIVLEDAKEEIEKDNEKLEKRLGRVMVRGNNIVSISLH
ncbi:MAG: RNA-binding protein [Thermoplasmatales archaeon]|nr:RNA-binding protein [Thermoplasmatales archaeon]